MNRSNGFLSALIVAIVLACTPLPAGCAQPAASVTDDPRPAAALSLIEQARQSSPAQAIPLYEKALALSEGALGPDHGALVEFLYGLGGAHYALGEYARALAFFQRSLAIDEKVFGPHHPGVAVDLNNVAGLHRELGEYARALPLYQRSLAIVENAFGPDHPNVAIGLNNLAVLYENVGAYAQALPLHQRSLAIREKAFGAEHPSVATSLNNLAGLSRATGEYAKALPLYERSLAIRETALGPKHPDVAVSLNNLAGLYRASGEYAKALPLYQRSLFIVETTLGAGHPDMALGFNNLAGLYHSMGEHSKALPLYERSLALREKLFGAGHPEVALGVNNLAVLHRDMGEYDKALPLYQRSLATLEKALGPGHPVVAIILNNLAGVYQAMGEHAKALPLYERSIVIREKALGPDHIDMAISLNNLAALRDNMGDNANALPLFQRALRIASNAGAPEVVWRVQAGLRNILAQQQRPEAAIFFGKLAVNTIQRLRGQLAGLPRESQRAFIQNKTDAYRGLADLLIEQGRLAEAQQVLAMLKEEEFFDFIRRNEAEDPRRHALQLQSYERPWHDRLQQIIALNGKLGAERAELERRVRLGPTQHDQARLAALVKEGAAAGAELERFYREVGLALAAARPESEGSEAVANLKALQRTLATLGPGTVAVHYVQADARLNILVTTADNQVARRVPIRATELNRMIDAFRRTLRSPRMKPQVVGRELHEALIAPIAEDLARAQARTLMVSLDGTLRYIPLAALHDGERYLVERYSLAIYTEVARDNVTRRPPTRRSIAGLGLTRAIDEFDALPAVKGELEAIVGSGRGIIPDEIHLDQAFSAEQMRRTLANRHPMLHIASHFVFRPGTEAHSFLLLGDGERLTLSRIKADKFDFSHIDLITLSACETGLGGGRDAQGEEIEGFGALVQKQGARGVVATLWPVADESTAQLMQSFYRLREEENLTKAEALRRAQLALIRGAQASAASAPQRGLKAAPDSQPTSAGNYSHPYYWAPFILMGNWL
jgi:CHAT domain-containing protein